MVYWKRSEVILRPQVVRNEEVRNNRSRQRHNWRIKENILHRFGSLQKEDSTKKRKIRREDHVKFWLLEVKRAMTKKVEIM